MRLIGTICESFITTQKIQKHIACQSIHTQLYILSTLYKKKMQAKFIIFLSVK